MLKNYILIEMYSGKIFILNTNSNINEFYLIVHSSHSTLFSVVICPLKVRRDKGCTKEIAVLEVDCPGKAEGCRWKGLLILYEVSIWV